MLHRHRHARTITHTVAHLLVCVGLAAALAACGGSSDSTGDAAQTTAGSGESSSGASGGAARSAKVSTGAQVCALLTAAQVTDALGTQVNDGEASSSGTPACNWWIESTAGSGLNVQAAGVSSVTSLASLIKSGMMKGEPAGGIGDEAYWDYALGEDRPALRFIKGGDGFYIAINGTPSPDPKAAETKIAKEILAKL